MQTTAITEVGSVTSFGGLQDVLSSKHSKIGRQRWKVEIKRTHDTNSTFKDNSIL